MQANGQLINHMVSQQVKYFIQQTQINSKLNSDLRIKLNSWIPTCFDPSKDESQAFAQIFCIKDRSQWPRGLRRRSAAARLLRLWVRIPPGAWMSVCCECCVLSGRGLCDGLITRPEEPYRLWCDVLCDLETSRMRRPWPTGGAVATKTQPAESASLNEPRLRQSTHIKGWYTQIDAGPSGHAV